MADEPADKGGNDPATGYQNLLAKKNGDTTLLATQLYDENFNLRRNRDSLKSEIEELKTKIPVEGSIVLSPDLVNLIHCHGRVAAEPSQTIT